MLAVQASRHAVGWSNEIVHPTFNSYSSPDLGLPLLRAEHAQKYRLGADWSLSSPFKIGDRSFILPILKVLIADWSI